jgi:hypothetical protein
MAIPVNVRALTDPYLGTFTPVPPVADGVCDVCHGASNPGWPRCLSCERTIGQVSRPLIRVVPITLCARMGPVHYLLRQIGVAVAAGMDADAMLVLVWVVLGAHRAVLAAHAF